MVWSLSPFYSAYVKDTSKRPWIRLWVENGRRKIQETLCNTNRCTVFPSNLLYSVSVWGILWVYCTWMDCSFDSIFIFSLRTVYFPSACEILYDVVQKAGVVSRCFPSILWHTLCSLSEPSMNRFEKLGYLRISIVSKIVANSV